MNYPSDSRARGKAHTQAARERKAFIMESNASERAKRSPQDQLKVLDRRLGRGVGAVKERARLSKAK